MRPAFFLMPHLKHLLLLNILSLVAMIFIYEVQLDNYVIACIKSGFLVPFLYGIWQENKRSVAFMSFVLLPYFMGACVQIFHPGNILIDSIILSLIVSGFILSILFMRKN